MTMFRKINRYMNPEAGDEGAGGSGGEASGGAVGTGNEARVALLESINDALDAGDRGEELAHVNDDDTTEPFRAEKVADKEDTPADKVDAAVENPAPEKVRIKVNGEELELTQEELIERAQKVEAADRYLAEAAAKKREAEALARQVAEQPEEIDYKALVRAIQVGTEAEAEAALRKLQTTGQRPSPMDDVSRVVDERLKFQDAMKAFSTEYADIISDSRLNQMAQQMDSEMLANGDTRSYAARYTEIGESLRGWVTKLGGGKKEEPKVDTSRQERKEALPTAPTVAAGKNTPPKTESDEDDNPSSVISKMAQARGGPQWMRA